MEIRDNSTHLSAKEENELSDELAELTGQQSRALALAVYLAMSRDEAKRYDLRRERITGISRLLGKHIPI